MKLLYKGEGGGPKYTIGGGERGVTDLKGVRGVVLDIVVG